MDSGTAYPATHEPRFGGACRKTTEQWPPFRAAAMSWECRSWRGAVAPASPAERWWKQEPWLGGDSRMRSVWLLDLGRISASNRAAWVVKQLG